MSRYFFICSLFWVLGAVAVAQDQRADSFRSLEDHVDSVRQANQGPAYRLVRKFLGITVIVFQEEGLGLSQKELAEYARLRFKNNFGTVELWQPGIPFRDFPPEEKVAVHGVMSFTVWIVGTDYPLAYHISMTAGTMGPTEELTVFDRYTDAALGCCSKRDLLDVVKRSIDSLMEDCALDFFKARGEI